MNGATMELGNHRVLSGDNLSKIAARYSSSVEQLRQLNPFIKDPNHIQIGWNLSVPAHRGSGSTVASPVSIKAAADKADQKRLTLGGEQFLNEETDASFLDAPLGCANCYAGIVYATEEKQFWLLTEDVLDAIEEASSELFQKISPEKSPQERKQGLDDIGLLEYFLQPKLTNFLSGEDYERADQIEAEVPDIDNWYYWWSKKAVELELPRNMFDRPHMEFPSSPEAREANRDRELYIRQARARGAEMEALHRERTQLQTLHDEWKVLQAKALVLAQEEGYVYENGALFSAEAMEARRRVQAYLSERARVLKRGLSASRLEQELAEVKQLEEQLHECLISCVGDLDVLTMARIHHHRRRGVYQSYVESIMALADYGLAVPEYALAKAPADGIADAETELQRYVDKQQQQAVLSASMQKKYRHWVQATGSNAQPPAGLLAEEEGQWKQLQGELDDLYEKAQQNVAANPIRRHLLWQPEQYQPRPAERMVRADFPLRELSAPGVKGKVVQALSLFSLSGISDQLSASYKEHVVEAMGKAVKRLPADAGGPGLESSTSTLFKQWLESHGAVPIDDQAGDWFDQHGWFDIEEFYKHLSEQSIQVEQLDDAAVRQSWGRNLQQVLFRADIRDGMRLFDSSPAAQLIRCLTPPQSSLHASMAVQGPTLSLAGGFESSVVANVGIDLARGIVELFSVDLPAQASAQDIVLTYLNYEGTTTPVSMGRYSLHLSALAWGYAGASMLLSAEISLTPNHFLWGGPGLDASEKAQRPGGGMVSSANLQGGAGAEFSVFAGIQAGISLTGALNWAPPQHLATVRTRSTGMQYGNQNSPPANQWLSLAKITAGMDVALGIGSNAKMAIQLSGGRLVLILEAAIVAGPGLKGHYSFEVSYEGVVDILNIFRRELYRNQGIPLVWVSEEAGSYMSKLNALGACGLNISMLYLLGINAVMSLYEAVTDGGRGGPIALSVLRDENENEFAGWVIDVTPSALGPLLLTLIAVPRSVEQLITSAAECLFLQQRAIEKILRWIAVAADQSPEHLENAQHQFGQACLRMNRYGLEEPNHGQVYRESRRKLDLFMEQKPSVSSSFEGDRIRRNYAEHVKTLGAQYDERHQYRRQSINHGVFWDRGLNSL
jgi:hypothetical protein